MEVDNEALLEMTWRSPSNIALVKYWGKHGRQLPSNPSISFTLSRAFTETTVLFTPRRDSATPIVKSFLFEGKTNQAFARRIETFLQQITDKLPFLQQLQLDISSVNSFPHSAGIASSASAMSALALCLVEGRQRLNGDSFDLEDTINEVSELARLGSGSASRSVVAPIGIWGAHPDIPGSSDRYAISFPFELHSSFDNWKDSILLVSDEVKAVSSSAGHQLMKNHPFARTRFKQARANIRRITVAMQQGDIGAFGTIVEEEALTLHGLMMNSRPSFMLLLPETVRIIQSLRRWRRQADVPVYFTLDAGPNVHLLYPSTHADRVLQWMEKELPEYLQSDKIVRDEVGMGPVKV